MMIHNKHLWPYCRKYGWRTWCLREEFLDNLCSIFPVQLMKTTRVGLNVISELVQDLRLKNLKILLLVRDPRAVIYSRSGYQWCRDSRFCREPSVLCEDLENDFKTMKKMQLDFPDRIMYLRYEDFAANPRREIREAAHFLGYQDEISAIEKYLDKKVDINSGKLITHRKGQIICLSILKNINT